MEKITIVIISHNFAKPVFCKRWKLLAMNNPHFDVVLLAPETWKEGNLKQYSFGFEKIIEGGEYDEGNFHIRLIDMKQHKFISWTSKRLWTIIRQVQPDIIFHIGTHLQESVMECILAKRLFSRRSKLVVFSMRGPQECIQMAQDRHGIRRLRSLLFYFYRMEKLRLVRNNCDAILCHYPDAVHLFREEAFHSPIYIHTQIGVDTSYFKADKQSREKIRARYNLGDSFVFGSAIRFTADKGGADILKALPLDGDWKYLLMGSGTEDETRELERIIKERNIGEKVIMTGFIDWEEMNQYYNALDCLIHVPRTTEHWVETFSLSVVQAMATAKPVIGNTSGSVPYQIGEEGMIVKEGDIEALSAKIKHMLSHPEEAGKTGEKMRERAEKCFSIRHLTLHIEAILKDIMNGIWDGDKEDMAVYLTDDEGKKG